MNARWVFLSIIIALFSGLPQVDASVGDPNYIVIDTSQQSCYDNTTEINCPNSAEAFYGQDSQYDGSQMYYQDNNDGTVTDLHTGLMWQKTPDANKSTYADAVAEASTFNLAGYNDWRLPSIKELYSLMDFRGVDPSGYNGNDVNLLTPFIDTDYFDFYYGDESAGERIIDSQYCSSTEYVSTTMNGDATLFGVNVADGRIKGYPRDTGPGGTPKTYCVRYVRGNTDYGTNKFVDNGDGTITDLATGLMWQKSDSGSGMNWQSALSYAENLTHAGYDDWRLPDAKELQGIVDYTRSPATHGTAAIDPIFNTTPITDEDGGSDFPFYWTGTTHVSWSAPNAQWGAYICFGTAFGWMEQPPESGNYNLRDVHGAGAQRSDPKAGDPNNYPNGHGPQGDVVRINNFVRCVRGYSTTYCQGLVTEGDSDTDCDIDIFDVNRFVENWLQSAPASDYTDDSNVNMQDYEVIAENFGSGENFTNLVILIADDMGWGDVGYHGSIIETPNIDQLTTDGVMLNYFYAFPICGPSRVALMTGRNPTRLGRTGNIQGDDGLDIEEHLLPESFKAAGYQTWCLGKWHLGGDPNEVFLPQNRGFDHFYGHLAGSVHPYNHTSGPQNQLDWQRNGVDVVEEGYTPDLLSAEAVSLLRSRDKSKPVLLYLPFHLVHTPLLAPQELIDKYTPLIPGDPNRAIYAAMAESLDIAIGRVLQEIDDQGMRDNTLVLFFSDNGGNENNGGASNDPLRGRKGQVWDGGIRTPAAMRWPGVLSPGTTSNQTISIMDLFATLTSAVGVTPQNTRPFDGNDRWEQIRTGTEVPPEAIVIQRNDTAILDGSWKMVRITSSGANRLYDIRNDQSEADNVAGSNPTVVTDLSAKMQAMLDTAP